MNWNWNYPDKKRQTETKAFLSTSEQILRDWYSGQPLPDDFEGEVQIDGDTSVLMETWIDKTSGERCWRGVTGVTK